MSDPPSLSIPRGFRALAAKAGIKPSGDWTWPSWPQTPTVRRPVPSPPIASVPHRSDGAGGRLPADDIRARPPSTSGNALDAAGDGEELGSRKPPRDPPRRSLLGCRAEQILVASTGVIGHQLPMERVEAGLRRASPLLSSETDAFRTASQAILTTDTRPKIVPIGQHAGPRRSATLLGSPRGPP